MEKKSEKKTAKQTEELTPIVEPKPIEAPVPVASNDPVYPFDIWFKIKKFKTHWYEPMREFALTNGLTPKTMEQWNSIFAQY